MKLGILPRKSSSVCIFTGVFVVRKLAYGNSDKHNSIVVEHPTRKQCCPAPQQSFAHLKSSRLRNQTLRELRVNAPVPDLIRIGQRRPADRTAKPYVQELPGLA